MLLKVMSPPDEEMYMRGMIYEGKKISEFPFLKGGSFSVIDNMGKEHFFDGSQVKIVIYEDDEDDEDYDDYDDYEDDYIGDDFP